MAVSSVEPVVGTSSRRTAAVVLGVLVVALIGVANPVAAAESDNKHALGEWDEGAKAPNSFSTDEKSDGPYDPSDWRVYLGGGAGAMVFGGELDLGGGNYEAKLTPHGGLSYSGRLGMDFGRIVS